MKPETALAGAQGRVFLILAHRTAFSYPDLQMAIQVHFTPEQEAQLAQLATKSGTHAEHLVKDAALRLLGEDACFRAAVR